MIERYIQKSPEPIASDIEISEVIKKATARVAREKLLAPDIATVIRHLNDREQQDRL